MGGQRGGSRGSSAVPGLAAVRAGPARTADRRGGGRASLAPGAPRERGSTRVPPQLRTCPARVYSRPAHPSAGGGQGNAINRLSLEETEGAGAHPKRASCAGAQRWLGRPRLLSPQPGELGRAAGGRDRDQRGIKRPQSPGDSDRWGRAGGRLVPRCVPGGVRARTPPSRGLTSIHFCASVKAGSGWGGSGGGCTSPSSSPGLAICRARRGAAAAGETPGTESPARGDCGRSEGLRRPLPASRCLSLPVPASRCLSPLAAAGAGAGAGALRSPAG